MGMNATGDTTSMPHVATSPTDLLATLSGAAHLDGERLLIDDEALAVQVGAAGDGGKEVGRRGRDVGHRCRVSCGVHAHGSAALRGPTPMTRFSGRA